MAYIIAGAILMTQSDWRFWFGVAIFAIGSVLRVIDMIDGQRIDITNH